MKSIVEQSDDLSRFLEPLLPLFGRSERRHWCDFYVHSLLLEGRRKTAATMARQYGGDEQSLQQFVTDSPWDWMSVRQGLSQQMVGVIKGKHIAWIIDETCFPKQGEHSVGVARQYCGTLGKTANSQSAVSLSFAADGVAFPVDFQLYLPGSWIDDMERRAEVGIPQDAAFKRNWEIALDLVDTAVSWGIPKGVVTADVAYGEVAEFRLALVERDLLYALGVQGKLSVWLEWVDLSRPVHQNELPKSMRAVDVAKSLPRNRWRMVTWREGSRGVMQSRFARVRVQPAHSGKTGIKPEGMQWLLIEWPQGEPEPIKYYLLNLPATLRFKKLVFAAKGRYPVELNYRELKDELGLDHFEGRSYQGWHHHITLTMMAFDFLIQQKVQEAKKGEL